MYFLLIINRFYDKILNILTILSFYKVITFIIKILLRLHVTSKALSCLYCCLLFLLLVSFFGLTDGSFFCVWFIVGVDACDQYPWTRVASPYIMRYTWERIDSKAVNRSMMVKRLYFERQFEFCCNQKIFLIFDHF